MKVLLVCNTLYMRGNGMSASARTTMTHLREAGVEVRALSMENLDPEGEQPYYALKKFFFPIFQPIIEKHCFSFAKTDRKIINEAVKWADVIHIEDPFILGIKAANAARRFKVPAVATYHLHPENIFYTLGMGKARLMNWIMLKIWQHHVFDKVSDIQCPTQNVLERLEKSGFKARLHLIPNGAILRKSNTVNEPQTDPYLILCIGRLAREKKQTTLISAMKYSRHADEIQLYFAGNGPHSRILKMKAAALGMKNPPKFGYHTADELAELERKAYLYIHCAVVEVEGLSCIEALEQGAVPVISKGELSATSQFALCEESIFPERDSKALAERIDWWIEHPEKRAEMSVKYAESVGKYEIHKSIEALIVMYKQAIDETA